MLALRARWNPITLQKSVSSKAATLRSRFQSNKTSTTSKPSTATPSSASNASKKLQKDATPEQVDAYLRNANAEMAKYHQAREQFRRGQLPNKNAKYGPPQNQGTIQAVIVAVFVVAFLAQPFIGKRLAQDKEFRDTWWPSWYDFTVRPPQHAWTREELHEQRVAVEKEIRERAIQGDFTPQKLQEMQQRFNQKNTYQPPQIEGADPNPQVPAGWSKIHPGLEEGESLNEE
jgi:hypothetical protein